MKVFQPRYLENPDDPVNSNWVLAISENEPDLDDNFDSVLDAASAGLEYAKENGLDPKNLRIAKIEITYLNLVVGGHSECAHNEQAFSERGLYCETCNADLEA